MLRKFAVALNLVVALLWLALPIWSLVVVGFSWNNVFYCLMPIFLIIGSVLCVRRSIGLIEACLCGFGSLMLCVLVARDIAQADIDLLGLRGLLLGMASVSAMATLYLLINTVKGRNEGALID